MLYSLHPLWLEHSINKSLKKLNIETLDCVYLQDPFENSLKLYRDVEATDKVIFDAFVLLEQMVQEGKIKSYGVSSDEALILDPYVHSIK